MHGHRFDPDGVFRGDTGQLKGLGSLQLPTDHPRPAVQTYRGKRQSLVLSMALREQILALNKDAGTTLFMSMLAGFIVFLHRYSGQGDIAVGCPVAGRSRSELEPLSGCFINSLVIRNQLDSDLTFKDLLQAVRETSLDAFSHQDLPFEKLVEHLHPQCDLSRNPLFQVFFNLVNLSGQKLEFPGIEAKRLDVANDTTKCDLTLYIHESPEQFTATINYNTDLFEDSTISWMLGHYQKLLGAEAIEPSQAIAALPVLSEAEQDNLSGCANRVGPDTPFTTFQEADCDQSIGARFGQQVLQHADRLAIITSEHEWTYSELDA
jgi:non-ribosomal peptide synthetase component F